VIIYAVSEQNNDILAGVTLSGAKFRLPSAKGQVREPAWSGFLK
jgi:TolB protein